MFEVMPYDSGCSSRKSMYDAKLTRFELAMRRVCVDVSRSAWGREKVTPLIVPTKSKITVSYDGEGSLYISVHNETNLSYVDLQGKIPEGVLSGDTLRAVSDALACSSGFDKVFPCWAVIFVLSASMKVSLRWVIRTGFDSIGGYQYQAITACKPKLKDELIVVQVKGFNVITTKRSCLVTTAMNLQAMGYGANLYSKDKLNFTLSEGSDKGFVLAVSGNPKSRLHKIGYCGMRFLNETLKFTRKDISGVWYVHDFIQGLWMRNESDRLKVSYMADDMYSSLKYEVIPKK